MKNKYSELDKALRSKIGGAQFEVQEHHWEDALRRLQDEPDDKKRPFLWIFLLGGLLLSALLTTGDYLLHKPQNKKQVQVNHYAPNDSEYRNVDEVEKDLLFTDKQIEESQSIAAQTNTEEIETTSNSMDEDFDSEVFQESYWNDPNSSNTNQDDHYYIEEEETLSSPTHSKLVKAKQNNIDISSLSEPNQKVDEPTKIISPERTINSDIPQQHLEASISSKKPMDLKGERSAQKNIGTKILAPFSIGESSSGPNIPKSWKSEGPNKIRNVLIKDGDYFKRLNPRYVDGLEHYNSVKMELVQNAHPPSSILKDKAQEDKKPIEEIQKEKTKRKIGLALPFVEKGKARLELVIGAAANSGFGPDTTPIAIFNNNFMPSVHASSTAPESAYRSAKSWGITPILGVNFTQPISSRLNLHTGLLMTYMSKLNIENRSYQVSYSFDKTITEFRIKRLGMLQLQVPLLFGFRPAKKHEFMLGGNFTYNITDVNSLDNIANISQQITKTLNYMDGFKRTDISLMAAYQYSLSDRLRLRAAYQFGLTDQTDDSFFKTQFKDVQRRMQLGLHWAIFK